jgi:hypothetical protein
MDPKEIKQIEQEIAWLESVNDHLQTDLEFIDTILRKSGFPQGVDSIKAAALEIIDDQDFNPES